MTREYTLEQLWNPYYRGIGKIDARSSSAQYAGLTTLNSGDTTVTVSTSVVQSDSLIYAQVYSNTRVTSGTMGGIEVTSITPGGSFIFTTPDGNQHRADDTQIAWWLFNQA